MVDGMGQTAKLLLIGRSTEMQPRRVLAKTHVSLLVVGQMVKRLFFACLTLTTGGSQVSVDVPPVLPDRGTLSMGLTPSVLPASCLLVHSVRSDNTARAKWSDIAQFETQFAFSHN